MKKMYCKKCGKLELKNNEPTGYFNSTTGLPEVKKIFRCVNPQCEWSINYKKPFSFWDLFPGGYESI